MDDTEDGVDGEKGEDDDTSGEVSVTWSVGALERFCDERELAGDDAKQVKCEEGEDGDEKVEGG